MSRWKLVDTAVIPGGGEMGLYHRQDDFSIRLPGQGELMNSRTHGSEDALGAIVGDRLARRPAASILVGGLGMGFTLASALARLAPDASVVVAELVPEVVLWNQGPLGANAGYPLHDPRVRVRQMDVAEILRDSNAAYDAIVLDVDNGPEGVTRKSNDRLYSPAGLARARQALTPLGTLAVWSASADPVFSARLHSSGFDVDEQRLRAHRGKGARHVVWMATRKD